MQTRGQARKAELLRSAEAGEIQRNEQGAEESVDVSSNKSVNEQIVQDKDDVIMTSMAKPKSKNLRHNSAQKLEQKVVERFDDEEEDDQDELGLDEADIKFDGTEFVKGVFCGGEGCALDREGRKARGITHVVSIWSNFEQRRPPDQNMVSSGHWRHFSRENRPTADMLNLLDDAVAFITKALHDNGRVCVISLEGVSRSATICAAYLIKTLSMSLRSATELLSTARPRVSINRGFWRQLLVYETQIRGIGSMTEEDLPGAILFEKDDLDAIADLYRASKQPISPTTATGFGMLSLLSHDSKRKSYDWRNATSPRLKSPRGSIDQLDHALESKAEV
mmetsp:Transcript_17792/g.35154  ORF Transcript_17792/g.35154 Transcript_17792/m.35154 type:complete len:336 (-) Transcript_17792:510-1517(-)|eukprot:CAMPEP_0171507730 /NCGR_PEP_ID=MMETSP0958-20121227/13713_1 /TAXON_ID=87120 /ORGANISM="Aurantiochytrium limacinum, Strain ATCCMYA-1381" /LENGTH=335 /DNA_ID=CAMNT_0012044563 /DNA_START=318 /DNA_END=1325 /DNA_ORIENTATION=+